MATLRAMSTPLFFFQVRLPKALNGLMTKRLPCIHNTVLLLIKHPCIVGPVVSVQHWTIQYAANDYVKTSNNSSADKSLSTFWTFKITKPPGIRYFSILRSARTLHDQARMDTRRVIFVVQNYLRERTDATTTNHILYRTTSLE